MQSYKFPFFRRFRSGIHLHGLLMFWTIGIILGTVIGSECGAEIYSMMHQALIAEVSIVSLAVCNLLPFVISAVVTRCGFPRLIYCLGFCKAIGVGYTGVLCLLSFEGAGWLARLFLFCSQLLSLPALWLMWLQCCAGEKFLTKRFFLLLCIYLVVAVIVDYKLAMRLQQLL